MPVTIAVDTTGIHHLDKPVTMTPTDSWTPRTIEAFRMLRQLQSGTGYEVELYATVANVFQKVATTTKHVKFDDEDNVTVSFDGQTYRVGIIL